MTPVFMSKNKLRIAVVHDHLGWRGGGERTSLALAIALGADYITAYAMDDVYPEYREELGERFKTLAQKPVSLRGVRFFWLRWLFWKNRRLLRQYDILIASGQPALEAVAGYAKKGASRILYNHTPPRRVFDLYEKSKAGYPAYLRPFFSLFIAFWRRAYLRSLDRMDYDVANSETVRQRTSKYTGREANAVVRPPVFVDRFKWIEDGDYFLSWARLDEAKRVELAVSAFAKMPDLKLVVASDGKCRAECEALSKGCPNITFVGALPDEELFRLVGKCRAAIYIPVDEDAGMTHLEANAAGKPVLGVDEGGLSDTILDGQTGIKLPKNPTVEDIMSAVKKMTPLWCADKREACEKHAAAFSYETFAQKMKAIVEWNDPSRPVIGVDASRWEDPRHPGEEKRSGVEIYSWRLLQSLADYFGSQPCRPRFYAPRTIPSLPSAIQKIIPPRRFWTFRGLSAELRHSPPAAFFTPAYLIPAFAPAASTAVIHDLAFEAHPERYGFADWLGQHHAWAANRRRAKKLVAVSAATAQEIVRRHSAVSEKVITIPPGYRPNPLFRSAETKGRTIIYVGRLDRKKNVGLLIEAFNLFSKRLPGWKLTLVGSDGLGAAEIRALARRSPFAENIVFAGYAAENEKAVLMSQAGIFAHPSGAEGSALSLLEAWDAGTAAVVADIPVMREIGEDAALYFRPGDPQDLAQKLYELATNVNARFGLAVCGREKLEKYSWEKTAEKIAQIINDTVKPA